MSFQIPPFLTLTFVLMMQPYSSIYLYYMVLYVVDGLAKTVYYSVFLRRIE